VTNYAQWRGLLLPNDADEQSKLFVGIAAERLRDPGAAAAMDAHPIYSAWQDCMLLEMSDTREFISFDLWCAWHGTTADRVLIDALGVRR
jgi:hypothetical protein